MRRLRRGNWKANYSDIRRTIQAAAISHTTGRLELANKGTLFLHEIAWVPLDLQPKLLRVLNSGDF